MGNWKISMDGWLAILCPFQHRSKTTMKCLWPVPFQMYLYFKSCTKGLSCQMDQSYDRKTSPFWAEKLDSYGCPPCLAGKIWHLASDPELYWYFGILDKSKVYYWKIWHFSCPFTKMCGGREAVLSWMGTLSGEIIAVFIFASLLLMRVRSLRKNLLL